MPSPGAASPPLRNSFPMLFLLFVFYFFEYPAQAVPVAICGRETSNTSETTVKDGRSLFSIVWNCVSTVIICAWVSIHPNVPPRSRKGALLRRFKMMAWAIIAPELVLAWAVRQWFSARIVVKTYKSCGWTMSHGHFLVMGGFSLVNVNVKEPKRPSWSFDFNNEKRDSVDIPTQEQYEENKLCYQEEKLDYEEAKYWYNEAKRCFELEKRRYEEGRHGENERRQYERAQQGFEDSRKRFEERRRRIDECRRRLEDCKEWSKDPYPVLDDDEKEQIEEGRRYEDDREEYEAERRCYEDGRELYQAERRWYEKILHETDENQERRRYEKERQQYEEQRLRYEEKVEHYQRRLRDHEAKCRFHRLGVLSFDHFCELVCEQRIDFPTITTEEIKDRSKGDFLSKMLAILQTTWFLVQCGARGLQGLTLTELELVTLALASLNAVTYAFWWHKPLGVQEPVRVHLKTLEEGPSPQAEQDDDDHMKDIRRIVAAIPGFFNLARPGHSLLQFLFLLFPNMFVIAITLILNALKMPRPTNRLGKRPLLAARIGYILRKIRYWAFRSFSRLFWHTLTGTRRRLFFYITFPVLFVLLLLFLFLLSPFFLVFFLVSFLFTSAFGIMTTNTIRPGAPHVPAFYSFETKSDRYSRMLVLAVFGVFLGGLHCIGWYFAYPTRFEHTLWRVTSLLITGIPFVVALIDFFVTTKKSSSHKGIRMVSFTLEVIMTTLLFIYVPARISLIGQALALLRHQPQAAFAAVDWTKYLPHVLS